MKMSIFVGAVGLCLATWSFADEPKLTFEALDGDGDGYISQTEAQAQKELSEHWKQADQNKDNKLDISEFSAFEGRERFTPPENMEEEGIGAAPTGK